MLKNLCKEKKTGNGKIYVKKSYCIFTAKCAVLTRFNEILIIEARREKRLNYLK
jgi:hypothetical protein